MASFQFPYGNNDVGNCHSKAHRFVLTRLIIDLEALRALAGTCVARLAREQEFARLYPDCEPGAMPPFGALYHQRVFVDQSLVGEAEMAFNAGTHTDAIRMHFGDFAELSSPVVGAFVRPPVAGEAGAGA